MGTTQVPGPGPVIEGVAQGVAWDVPVRLVLDTGRASDRAADGVRRQVSLGMHLPGVAAVVVETQTVAGRTCVAAIRPDREVAEGPGVPLRELLEGLAGADGTVGVVFGGSRFAHDVLRALCEVGLGERCTYAELAASAWHPRAVRAAAHVMASNAVPLLLPCHRVVPSAGGTGRYGWGDAVKPVLLDAELQAVRGVPDLSGRRGR